MKAILSKSFLFIVVLYSVATSCYAQSKANATFFTENGEKFWLVMNGVKINPEAQYHVRASDLDQPGYKIKIIFQDQNLGTVDKNITTQDYNTGKFMDVVYAIKKNKKGEFVLRVASFDEAETAAKTVPAESRPEPSPAKPQETVTEKTVVTTTTAGYGTGQDNGENVNVGMNVGGESMNVNFSVNDNMGGGTMQSTTVTTTTTTTSSSSSSYTEEKPTPAAPATPKGCETAMNAADYASAKKSISGQSFSDTQMKVASQVVKANCLNVAQVRGIMDIFSFEEQKLEFAKMAYPKTVDKGNYYQLNEGFSFSGSVDDLNSFLEQQ